MITALVVGIIVFAFCLSMLLVAYTLFAQQSRNQVLLGCKTLACSTAEELEAEAADSSSELSKYLNTKLENINNNASEPKVVEFMLAGTAETGGYDVIVSFDIKGKKYLESDKKYYLSDTSYRNLYYRFRAL